MINWYHFFDNSTVAALISVGVGVCIATRQYKKQKEIDRLERQKDRLINLLIELKANLEEVDFILQRTLNTYKWIKNEKGDLQRFLIALEKHEIPRLSILINEKIPLTDKNLTVYLNIFSENKENIKNLHKEYKNKLKKWHDFIATNYKEWIHSITEQEEISPQLSIKEIEESIDKLIEKIKNI